MAFGIAIINGGNDTIITESFKNYCSVSSGSLANSVSAFSDYTILAIRPSSMGATIEPCTDNWGYYSSSGAINYVTAHLNPTAVSSNGLLVYTSAGEVAYDSGRRMVCPVLQYVWNPPGNATYASVTLSLPAVEAGKTRYILSNSLDVYGLGEGFWYGTAVIWNSDTSVTFELRNLSYSLGPPGMSTFDVWGPAPYFVSFVDI